MYNFDIILSGLDLIDIKVNFFNFLAFLHNNFANFHHESLFQVWLDDHKDLFYRFVPLAKDVDVGDISGRVALRKKLQCKSFDWYLKNLLPALPTESRLLASGQVW